MRAGNLDRPVELRHRVLTQNAAGEKVASWPSTYASVWAQKRDVRGMKRFTAQQFVADQTTEFTLRHRTDVLQTDRLVTTDDGKVYEITQIAEIGRREGLDLLCRAIVS